MKFPKFNGGDEGLTVDPSCPRVRFTSTGEQILENTPVEVPIGWNAPETLEMQIARMVRSEVSRAAVDNGLDSLEEAYDFDMDGDDAFEDHLTPAEIHALMHAPEMKEERPLNTGNKENRDVRERVGSREESSGDSAEGVRDGDSRVSRGGGKKYAGDRKGDGRKDETLRVRRGADDGGDSGVGAGD